MTSPKAENEKRFGRSDEVYAVGAVIVAWNRCEGALFHILFRTLKVDWEMATRIFDLLGNQQRIDLLRLEAAKRLAAEENDRVIAFLAAYGTCMENRNVIAHSQISMDDIDGGLALLKKSRKDPSFLNRFHIPLDEMLEIANTIYNLAQNGEKLSMSIWAGPSRQLSAAGKPFPVPLPDNFPPPRKLTPRAPEWRKSSQSVPQVPGQ